MYFKKNCQKNDFMESFSIFFNKDRKIPSDKLFFLEEHKILKKMV